MPAPRILLRTPRLVFRDFTTADVDRLVELDADPEVMRYISKGQPTPRETFINDVLPRWFAFQARQPPQGFWAAHLGDDGPFIGWFHLRPDKFVPEEMELGYRLHRRFWGQGLATEGSRALVEAGFREWNIGKISARTLVTNLTSQRVMAKAGLQFEAYFDYPEAWLPDWTAEERKAVKFSRVRA